jgi:hypothetical protein
MSRRDEVSKLPPEDLRLGQTTTAISSLNEACFHTLDTCVIDRPFSEIMLPLMRNCFFAERCTRCSWCREGGAISWLPILLASSWKSRSREKHRPSARLVVADIDDVDEPKRAAGIKTELRREAFVNVNHQLGLEPGMISKKRLPVRSRVIAATRFSSYSNCAVLNHCLLSKGRTQWLGFRMLLDIVIGEVDEDGGLMSLRDEIVGALSCLGSAATVITA